MKFQYIVQFFALTVWLFLGTACEPRQLEEDHLKHDHDHGAHDDHDDHTDDHDDHGDHGAHEDGDVHFSQAQVDAIGLKTGTFTERKMAGFIKAGGKIELPPQALASVHAPATGFVKSISNLTVGSYVKKGSVLARIEHPDFIQKQQEYLENTHQLVWLEQEEVRQKELNEANAGALKAYQKIQSKVRSMKAHQAGLRAHLRFLGINTDNLQSGQISSTITLRAPISGYINSISLQKGMLAQPETPLFTLANSSKKLLRLQVFEKDIPRLQKGQKISFSFPSQSSKIHEAHIQQISQMLNSENKSISVICSIKKPDKSLIPGLYAEARIWQNERTLPALPIAAVQQIGGLNYIFFQEMEGNEISFKKRLVNITQSSEDWVVIEQLEAIKPAAKIVTHGAWYIVAEMKKGEAGHGH